MIYQLSACIVVYKNDHKQIRTVINCLKNTRHPVKIFLVDNSPTDELQQALKEDIADQQILYIHNDSNIGFGKAHNIAISHAIHLSKYHLVLNPDIAFKATAIDQMFDFMEANEGVGQLMPKVYNSDGSLQKHCKRLPRPLDLLGRRFCSRFAWAKERNSEYELKDFTYNHCLNVPNLCGCFMFLRTSCLKTTGGFDSRFFMYLEDVDLTRRIHSIAQTVYYPFASIVHDYQRGSYSNKKLLLHHIASTFLYFFKWGWLFDQQRDTFNHRLRESVLAGNKLINFDTNMPVEENLRPAGGQLTIPA